VHGPVDHDRAVVYGSTVDHGRRWMNGSPELALGAAPVSGSSPVVGKRRREPRGFLPWVRVGGAVPEGGRRRRGMEHGVDAWCWVARGTDKRS
jgi:hypothetical protein